MPAIKAYNIRGTLIPVDKIGPVKKVYQCPKTLKIFKTKKAYVTYIKKIRRPALHADIKKKNAQKRFNNEYMSLCTLQEKFEWINNNNELLYDILPYAAFDRWMVCKARAKVPYEQSGFVFKVKAFEGRQILDYTTCSAPKGIETSYRAEDAYRMPSIYGSIKCETALSTYGESYPDNMIILKILGFHGRTGSYGNNMRADVTCWIADHPGLEMQYIADVLADNSKKEVLYGY